LITNTITHTPPPNTASLLGVYCDDAAVLTQAQQLSQHLSQQALLPPEQPLLSKAPSRLDGGHFVLLVGAQGVCLQATGKKAPGPIRVDFMEGASAHRRQFGGGKGQMIAKAIGVKGAYRPHILDLTAGLGQDGFVLSTLGCEITLIERSPIVHALLQDGLNRAGLSADPELHDILQRITLQNIQSDDYLQQQDQPIDVIYFDPMFPERTGKAEVNKSMKAFHSLVGSDDDAGEILSLALTKAQYRVVVKRPRKAPAIHEQYPDLALPAPNVVFDGKSTRFDVYTFKKMP
jgi:16S rRNA (guanine1516-N2)-methyltransferase